MKQKGFRIKKLVAPAKVEILGVYHHSIVACQLLGPDVNLLLAQTEEGPMWRCILLIISPERYRPRKTNGEPDTTHPDFDEEAWDHFEWAEKLFQIWSLLWQAINNVGIPRDEKANAVDRLGGELIKHWGGKHRTTHLYPHMMCAHLGDDIRSLPEGVDITAAQTQGGENKHQELKADVTNNAAPHALTVVSVRATTKMVGSKEIVIKAAHTKSLGTDLGYCSCWRGAACGAI